MTRSRRKLLIQTILLGVGLTLLVVIADVFGLLSSLENWAYDRRAARCQFFAKPPTTQLVHLDIDDTALGQIGRWPWPRDVLGELLDELALAHPKAVALDITSPIDEEMRYEKQPDGSFTSIDGDAIYAAALKRVGVAILPVDLDLESPKRKPAVIRAINEEYTKDLWITDIELTRRLHTRGFPETEIAGAVADTYLLQADAVYARMMSLWRDPAPDLQTMTESILGTSGKGSELRLGARDLIRKQYQRASAVRAVASLAATQPTNTPDITPAEDLKTVPVEALSRAAAGSGFVSFEFLPDGVIRSLPLLVSTGGKIYPQFGLALALKTMDVSPADLRLTPTSLVIPRHDGSQIVIPTRSTYSDRIGATVRVMLDIPWFGTSDWRTMYDHPRHTQVMQHESLNLLWRPCSTRRKIQNNNLSAERAIATILGDGPGGLNIAPARAAEFAKKLPELNDAEARSFRMEFARVALHELQDAGWVEAFAQMKESDDDEKTRLQRHNLFASKAALEQILKQDEKLDLQLRKERADLKAMLDGKAVLIGWIASGKTDKIPTPLHALCPGVVVHGAIFNSVMTANFWYRAPEWITVALTLVLGLLTAFAAIELTPTRAALFAMLLAAVYIAFNCVYLFAYRSTILGLSPPIVAIAIVYSGCTLVRIILEGRERALITRRFSNYADPMLVDYLIEHPEQARFEGQVRELTVVFTDLQGFTSISEQLGEKSVTLLNKYLGIMVPIIRQNRGYVNKFLGDGIMFFFGAPYENKDHATAALKTVLEMQRAMVPFNQELAAAGLTPLIMRAGVGTGEMVVGDAGSLNPERSDYTVLGDVVNLSARLESGNKAMGTRMLANARARELGGAGLLLRPVGSFCYLGKVEGTPTFEIVATLPEATDTQKKLAATWDQLVTDFAAARFDACIATLTWIETESGPTKLTKLYRELCERYSQEGAPVGFVGNIVLSEK